MRFTHEELAAGLREHMKPGEEVTMTEATERLMGTSGRGNPRVVAMIERMAINGYVTIRNVGKRTRYVKLTDKK